MPETTRKLLETINKFSKVAGYKINLEKLVAFLFANNKQLEKEYKETFPLMIASKNKLSRNKLDQIH